MEIWSITLWLAEGFFLYNIVQFFTMGKKLHSCTHLPGIYWNSAVGQVLLPIWQKKKRLSHSGICILERQMIISSRIDNSIGLMITSEVLGKRCWEFFEWCSLKKRHFSWQLRQEGRERKKWNRNKMCAEILWWEGACDGFEEPRAAALGSVVQHVSRYSELQNEAEAGSWKQSSQGLTNHMDWNFFSQSKEKLLKDFVFKQA